MSDSDAPQPPSAELLSRLRAFAYTPDAPPGSPVASTSRLPVRSSPSPSLKRTRSNSASNEVRGNVEGQEAQAKVQKGRYKKGKRREYASPEKYAHLLPIPDILKEDIDILWLGINPGKASAANQHFFAAPSNRFWTYLFKSGCTPEKLPPEQDVNFPSLFNYGLTNLIERPTTSESELAREEYLKGVPSFLRKVIKYRPKVVATCGKTIAQGIVAALAPQLMSGRTKKKRGPTHAESPFFYKTSGAQVPTPDPKQSSSGLQMGLQSLVLIHPAGQTYLIALPSPSGLETHYQGAPAIALFASVKSLSDQVKAGEQPELKERVEVDIEYWLKDNGESVDIADV